MITASLSYALPHLARNCTTGYLWIGQITIDQQNLAERTTQVKIMGKIYMRSVGCLVWMDDGKALDLTSEIEPSWEGPAGVEVRRFLQDIDEDEFRDPDASKAKDRVLKPRRPSSGEQFRVREHLLWFFEHPWFTRTWVYQEYIMAKQGFFLIGGFRLPMKEVERLFKHGFPRNAR